MTKEGAVENLQVRSVFDLSKLSNEDLAQLTEAFNSIDHIARKQGSMPLVPTGYRQISDPNELHRDLTIVLGWKAFKTTNMLA